MEVKSFKDGIKVSRLGMGNMRLPVIENTETIDFLKSQEIIDYAMSHGINYYDTAYVYSKGDSERFLGHAMKEYKRDSFYLATKWNYGANPDFKAVFQEQLERLNTDYIDFYLIHCLTDDNIDSYIQSGGIEYFLEMKRIGKIKYLGFSSHASVETLRRFADYTNWDFAQLQINYLDWNYSKTKEEYQILKDRNIPTMVMEPVRGGRFAKISHPAEALLKHAHKDWAIASWALRIVRTLDNVLVILSGMSSLEQIKDNIETFNDDTKLTKEDIDILFKACRIFHEDIYIPCTGCRYCVDDCPSSINIPEYLKLLNDYKIEGMDTFEDREEIKSIGTPKDCIKCETCMGHCPQNIKIPSFLEELAKLLK
jgi:predicted aldo/keto reductase-like oxidoreductase